MESKSDHRELGRQLDLYAGSPLVGPGLPLWLPAGAVLRAELEKLAAEEARLGGCLPVYTPVLAKKELFERSGHWEKFSDDMFPPMRVGEEELVLRPANCPHHALVYAARPRSYRDLPLRLAEVGSMFRSELSGVVSGLSRVRQISLDDCHVFCAPEQVGAEALRGLRSVQRCYELLGIEVAYYRLSLRGEGPGYLGSDEQWLSAQAALAGALDQLGLPYEEAPGEAAFYGPKIDVQVAGASGQEVTLSTVQLDFNQPERFELEYVGADGHRHRPVMIHRGVLSSMERLVAHLLEVHDGNLPPWLSPVQVQILPIAEGHAEAGRSLQERLLAAGLRGEVASAGTLGARVREAWARRVPYVAVLGDREVEAASVALRVRDGKQVSMPVDAFVAGLAEEVAARRLRPELGFLRQPSS